jgi:hypothetical protein
MAWVTMPARREWPRPVRIQPCLCTQPPDGAPDRLRFELLAGVAAAPDATEHVASADYAGVEPAPEGADGAGRFVLAEGNPDLAPGALRIGFPPPDEHREAFLAKLQIFDGERSQLAAPEAAGEAQQEQRPVPEGQQIVAGREHREQVFQQQGVLPSWRTPWVRSMPARTGPMEGSWRMENPNTLPSVAARRRTVETFSPWRGREAR